MEEQLVLFYGKGLLDLLESNPSVTDYSWLALSTRTPRWAIHPLRQLLLIGFLYGSFRAFHERSNDEGSPFGNGPWPCLNKAADHYKDFIITQCIITRCSDSGRPVGTFMCSCGFSYSRRGPDQSEDDKFYRGRIKSFGSVWVDRLQRCIQEGMSYRSSAGILGVDTNTVIKYANGAVMHREIISIQKKTKKVRASLRSSATKNKTNNRVDWEKRDLEISWMAEEACKSILSDINSKPIRISIAMIGKRIGKLSWLEKHQQRLPITLRILSNYVESVSQFQMRRVRWAAERMAGEWPLKRWKLEKMAGLRPDYSQAVSDEIDRCIGQSIISFNFTSSEVITSWQH
ncbi:hypothetical protein G9U52_37090 [Paenibacillus sp. S3N08]|uniref:Transposon Tn7 transposition protein TnsD C-terminal domain-containing protein n=1 Tax=Paenibacillus agricola TaxID=2716264 RepID=A0ABX0JJ13_9BACL|nr:hypothetical protein [Paenibacillus agricola]